jgi:uncharacterized protein
MTSQDRNHPWYADGLAFECTQCGRCCGGPEEGYVWIDPDEIETAARHLGVSGEEFTRLYTRRIGRRVSLIEQANADCVFLQPNGDGTRGCRIYSVRPAQCCTWPFWSSNLTSQQAWNSAGKRCPGVNRGNLFALDHIEHERSRTE